ncbi:MAG: hypothetical protein JWM55_1220 [Acidimicrobiaceae bacterium]|nr:hypothetical protein [Acidimicrobiaceae bacterium]
MLGRARYGVGCDTDPMGRAEKLRAEMSAELAPLLAPGEKIVMFGGCTAQVDRLGATFTRRGTLFVSDQRCGVLTKKIGGHDLVGVPLALIEDVEFDRNVTAAQMTVTGAGLTLKMARMQVNGAKEFVRALREQMAKAQTRVEVTSDPPGSQSSVADEIKKFAELKEQGIISGEEFDVQRKRLLDS